MRDMRDMRDIDNLEIITWAPNGIKLLRQLILKNAVTGKLVKQTSEEETGVELITRILESRGLKASAENRPDSEIPQNWGRAKLGEIFHLEMGQSPNSDSYNSQKEGLPFYQGKTDFGSFVPTPRVWCSSPTKIAETGDVLLSVRAPVGPTNYADERCCIGRGLAAVRPLGGMRTEFVLWWLRAYESQIADMGTGTTFIAVSKRNLEPFMLSIPPLSEQDRILEKINELMSLCDKLEAQISLYNALGTAARNSAVNAISTARNPKELRFAWERIQSNWEVIAGTPESIESLRELILDVLFKPKKIDEWEVRSFGDLLTISNGDRSKNYPSKEFRVSAGIPFVNAGHLKDGRVDLSEMDYISREKYESLSGGKFQDGDILFCLRGSLGKSALVRNFGEGTIASSLAILRVGVEIDAEYLLWFLQSGMARLQIKRFDNGTAQPNLAAKSVLKFEIPLPKLSEQKSIVNKVAELMKICDQLQQILIQKEEIAEKFARSVVSASA